MLITLMLKNNYKKFSNSSKKENYSSTTYFISLTHFKWFTGIWFCEKPTVFQNIPHSVFASQEHLLLREQEGQWFVEKVVTSPPYCSPEENVHVRTHRSQTQKLLSQHPATLLLLTIRFFPRCVGTPVCLLENSTLHLCCQESPGPWRHIQVWEALWHTCFLEQFHKLQDPDIQWKTRPMMVSTAWHHRRQSQLMYWVTNTQ